MRMRGRGISIDFIFPSPPFLLRPLWARKEEGGQQQSHMPTGLQPVVSTQGDGGRVSQLSKNKKGA